MMDKAGRINEVFLADTRFQVAIAYWRFVNMTRDTFASGQTQR